MSLHHKAISEELRELLKQLMQMPELGGFYLVGGTSLALRFGHRISLDIDLFTEKPFNADALRSALTEHFKLVESTVAENTLTGSINGIKVDFIAHIYPLLGEIEVIEGIRILSVEDIAAMKLNAIANRGSKKDFYDIFELLQHFNLSKLLGFFEKKYPESSVWNVEKSLSFFEDAELEPDPIDLKGLTWKRVKNQIQEVNRLR